MTHFLLKTFIKNYNDTKDNTVRKKCGFLSSIIGIICNILLFIVKFIIGTISASVAIISDAFNNLSDCLSCIVTLIAYNLAEKPADKEHPFGYGRVEYFSSLLIGCLIIIVGWEFLKTSWSKIFHYQQVQVSIYTIIALIFSILLKLWLFVFNKKLATIYNNSTMAATAYDSLSDSITTSVTLVGTIISLFTSFPVDGIIGILVSLLIIKTAVSIIKDTIDTLLGKPADKETVQEVLNIVLSYPEILGVHDLIIHNYGPNHMLASLHAEINSKMNIMIAHEIIDKIEKELNDKLHIMTTIHLDPIETDNEQLNRYKEIVEKVLKEIDPSLSFHDFRMVNGQNNINLIFDILLTDNYNRCKGQLKTQIDQKLQQIDPRLHTVITFDNQF
ncbi:MAG: cation diffusion facilitator family transporter [Erysipelotrichia bacterium]|nr:cation diffusion facilitator family transporter [Erysipelotrichia bacterium]